MNEHDSQKMESMLRRDGYVRALNAQEADLVVVNTCSIREKSYQKAVSEIGRASKNACHEEGKKPVIAVTGCVVSHDGENIMKRFPYVDMVLGPDHIAALPALARQSEEKKERFARTDFHDLSDYEFPPNVFWQASNDAEKPVKAYVTIMKCCDNACSFCIVPFVRGKEVSRPSVEIIDEIKRLEEQGVQEVTLLGQTVNSYGKGLLEKTTFPQLLRKIDQETAIKRL